MPEPMARPGTKVLSIARHPIYAMLLPVPVVCFVAVVATDLAYQGSGGNLIWLNFSSWLLLIGLAFGFVSAILMLIDSIRSRAMRGMIGLAHVLLFFAAWIIELVNMLVHNRDGWTAVVPAGLTLSIIGALLILVAAWLRRPAMETVR